MRLRRMSSATNNARRATLKEIVRRPPAPNRAPVNRSERRQLERALRKEARRKERLLNAR